MTIAYEVKPELFYGVNEVESARMFGIDVSRWQGNVNWASVSFHMPVVIFAGIRATVANYYADDQFLHNMQGAKQYGIARLPYHVIRADKTIGGKSNSAQAQMDCFTQVVGNDHDGVFVLDVELQHVYGSSTVLLPKSQITDCVCECRDILEARYGTDSTLIYTRAGFMDGYMVKSATTYADWLLWLAQYGKDDGQYHGAPSLPYGVSAWQAILHQYTSKGAPFGVDSAVLDYDAVLNVDKFIDIVDMPIIGEAPPEPTFEEKVLALLTEIRDAVA